MRTLFHADRFGKLARGKALELERVMDPELSHLQPHLLALFPAGISRWGYFLLEPLVEGAEKEPRWRSVLLETSFEWIRRARFPSRPSRFQCLFARDSPDAARRALGLPGARGITVWQVAPVAPPFRADMSWIRPANSSLEISYNAHRYWSGEPVTDVPDWEWLCPLPVRIGSRAARQKAKSPAHEERSQRERRRRGV